MKTGKQLGYEPANPTLEFFQYSDDCPFDSKTTEGLTKREYFAGLALQSIMRNIPNGIGCSKTEYATHWAACYADALLEELSK